MTEIVNPRVSVTVYGTAKGQTKATDTREARSYEYQNMHIRFNNGQFPIEHRHFVNQGDIAIEPGEYTAELDLRTDRNFGYRIRLSNFTAAK